MTASADVTFFWLSVDGETCNMTFVRVFIRSHTPGSESYTTSPIVWIDLKREIPATSGRKLSSVMDTRALVTTLAIGTAL